MFSTCSLVKKKMVYRIPIQRCLLGRGKKCSIRIKDATVSRVHAELIYSPEFKTLFVNDLQSHNGTFVNEKRVDAVSVVGQCKLRFGKVGFQLKNTEWGEELSVLECDEPPISTLSMVAEDPHEFGLTPAESIVLRRMLLGESEREAAENMHVSFHTVHNHVRSIYRKTGVCSRPTLMALFIDKNALQATKAE